MRSTGGRSDDTFDVVGQAIHASFLPADAGFGGSHSSVNHGTGSSSGATGSTSTVVVNSGGITFDLIFDAVAMAAPQSFRTGIEQAASILSASISDQITVNIKIDYSGTGGGAAAGPDTGYYESYSSITSDLLANATPGDTTFNALPSGTSIQGQSNIAVWNAQMKVLGLMNPNDTTTDDGSATFATDINPNLLVGVALHELTHALGRIPYGTAPDIFDLFRYTSPATRLFSGGLPLLPLISRWTAA
jgi:serralysin